MPDAGDRHGKTRRNSLSDERILAEALALADEAGLDGLTTRALGRRLGSSPPPSTPLRSKEELLGALADRILADGDGAQAAATATTASVASCAACVWVCAGRCWLIRR